MQFAKYLRDTRGALGVTQEALARDLEVTLSSLQKWERGLQEPKPLTQRGIRAALAEIESKEKHGE